jgi:death on curing protein
VTQYLTVEQALRIARTAVGGPIYVRDVGLLEAAVHRPRTSVLGQDA